MRRVSELALLATALALGGCAATSGGTLSGSGTLVSDVGVCGLNPSCQPVETPPDPNAGGGAVGTPDPNDPDPPPGANNGNSGNNASFSGANDTIALEAGIVVTRKGTPSKSRLVTQTGTKRFEIETKTANNDLWAKPKDMKEYVYGTNASGGVGLGGTYKEYRSYIADAAKPYDELLQVWTFDHSYAYQYRDETSGNDVADKQAWSFAGKTGTSATTDAAMPSTRATATYNGFFGSTAITENWENTDNPTQAVNYNNSWRVRGTTTGNVNFATARVKAAMTPQFWQTERDLNGYTGTETVTAGDVANINHAGFMTGQILVNGVLTKSATGNSIAGSGNMSTTGGWLSDGTTGLFFGGIYGPDADEVTGVFSASGTLPAPIGGEYPLNNPRRGRLTHSGTFNMTK
jgi:hypothetical protein